MGGGEWQRESDPGFNSEPVCGQKDTAGLTQGLRL